MELLALLVKMGLKKIATGGNLTLNNQINQLKIIQYKKTLALHSSTLCSLYLYAKCTKSTILILSEASPPLTILLSEC